GGVVGLAVVVALCFDPEPERHLQAPRQQSP
ncbi:MAG: hypothetical protein ACI841_005327, partial [Planctomycetota bacterium]